MIKARYADEHPRRTEIRSFDTIEATKVVEANEKLYVNRADGFMGTSLKKDEFVENCSNIDDVIIFYRDGTYKVTRVAEKVYIGETERSKAEKKKAEIVHIAVFKKNDQRTIYNVVYRDGKDGAYYIKRFNVTSITHDREYDLTRGEKGSKIQYFTANPNGAGRSDQSDAETEPEVAPHLLRQEFLRVGGEGSCLEGQFAHPLGRVAHHAQIARRFDAGRSQGVVRSRCAALELRRTRQLPRRVPHGRSRARGAR